MAFPQGSACNVELFYSSFAFAQLLGVQEFRSYRSYRR